MKFPARTILFLIGQDPRLPANPCYPEKRMVRRKTI